MKGNGNESVSCVYIYIYIYIYIMILDTWNIFYVLSGLNLASYGKLSLQWAFSTSNKGLLLPLHKN